MKGIRMLALLLAVAALAVALGLSKSARSTAALAKDGTVSAAPVPQGTPPNYCHLITPVSVSDDPNGERTTTLHGSTCEYFDNPCTFRRDYFSVETHMVTHTRVDSSGGVHMRSHIEKHGTSITPDEFYQCNSGEISRARTSTRAGGDGVAYIKAGAGDSVFNFVKNSGLNTSGPPPETFDDPLNIRVISRGGAPNYILHQTLHTTINANGDVTACVTNERTSCQGGGGGGNTNAGGQ